MGERTSHALLITLLAATGCAYNAQKRATDWIVVETESIRLRTSLSPERAQEIARKLQELRDLLAGAVLRCAFREEAERIQVTVLPTSEFEDVYPQAEGTYRGWALSWLPDYEGQIVLPNRFYSDSREVYQHELTHQLVKECMPRAPLWVDEGLATLLQTATIRDGRLVVGLPAYVFRRNLTFPERGHADGVDVIEIRAGWLTPVDTVVHLPSEQFHAGSIWGGGGHRNYATSWLLVHMLELGADDLHSRFVAFLTGLRRVDADPEKLFAAHFGDVDLQARLRAYILRGRYPYVVLRTAVPRRAAPLVRPMSPGEGHLQWAWLWAGVSGDKGGRHLREHLDAAERDPNTTGRAHLLAAITRALARDLAGAEREVQVGLRAAPDDPALLHAEIDLLIARDADPSRVAARLRPLARTADQLCSVAAADLVARDVRQALNLGLRALQRKPTSRTCRKIVELARTSMNTR
ncbi:MAG TPA: hypothetical protein VK698_11710 [Kofleriaceae bacterium]|nr:hypothetical protein [Kofleriaceae bacterium]